MDWLREAGSRQAHRREGALLERARNTPVTQSRAGTLLTQCDVLVPGRLLCLVACGYGIVDEWVVHCRLMNGVGALGTALCLGIIPFVSSTPIIIALLATSQVDKSHDLLLCITSHPTSQCSVLYYQCIDGCVVVWMAQFLNSATNSGEPPPLCFVFYARH